RAGRAPSDLLACATAAVDPVGVVDGAHGARLREGPRTVTAGERRASPVEEKFSLATLDGGKSQCCNPRTHLVVRGRGETPRTTTCGGRRDPADSRPPTTTTTGTGIVADSLGSSPPHAGRSSDATAATHDGRCNQATNHRGELAHGHGAGAGRHRDPPSLH